MSKTYALLIGVVLLVIGICGMLTGGHDHPLVVFGINHAHNLVHVLSGAVAIVCGIAGRGPARVFLMSFGVVYGLVAVLGLVQVGFVVQMLNINMADNLLHLGIAASCLLVAFMDKSAAPATA